MSLVSKIFVGLFMVVLMILVFCAQIEAVAHKPVITGNYEQGWRLYESDEASGDDYFFRETWLKYKQSLNSQSYYYIKCRLYETDFTSKDQYDSVTFDLLFNYTEQISKLFRLKTEVSWRDKSYRKADTKNYYELMGELELTIKPWKSDQFRCTVKLQKENYPISDKDNLLQGVTASWEHKIFTQLNVNSTYSLTKEDYVNDNSLPDKLRYSFSVGFEYQM